MAVSSTCFSTPDDEELRSRTLGGRSEEGVRCRVQTSKPLASFLLILLACEDTEGAPDPRVAPLEATVASQAELIDALSVRLAALESAGFATHADLEAQLGSLAELAPFLVVEGTNITLTGANLHIVSGAGTTDAAVNGLGNLVVGYAEAAGTELRTGSHNLIVGPLHDYTSYGALIAGRDNQVTAPYATVTGGEQGVASGELSVVTAGRGNTASAANSWAGGGTYNLASEKFASVAGGYRNVASGVSSMVSGGFEGTASAEAAVVSAGYRNIAGGVYSAVSGGERNDATGQESAICAGSANTATGDSASVVGGYMNDATAASSSILGGYNNTAAGVWSSVLGGQNQSVGADYEVGP